MFFYVMNFYFFVDSIFFKCSRKNASSFIWVCDLQKLCIGKGLSSDEIRSCVDSTTYRYEYSNKWASTIITCPNLVSNLRPFPRYASEIIIEGK